MTDVWLNCSWYIGIFGTIQLMLRIRLKVMKVMKHAEVWDDKLAWYSPSVSGKFIAGILFEAKFRI